MTDIDTNGLENNPHFSPLAAASPRRKRGRKGKPRKARKQNTGHRGVRLLAPSGPKAPHWRVMYRDSDSGDTIYARVPFDYAATVEGRRDFALELHRKHVRRREDLDAGATPITARSVPLKDAFAEYFDTWGARKRDATCKSYKRGAALFMAWSALPKIDLRKTRELTRGALRRYAGARAAVQLKDGTGPRAAPTVNKELKWLGAVLQALRGMDLIALSQEDIREGLALLDEDTEKRAFHRSAALRAILAACRVHDTKPTRGRYRGRMFSVTLFMLLSGMRVDEAIWIEWRDIEIDDAGHVLIRVRAEIAKNRKTRFLNTRYSPLLAHLVSAHSGRTGRIIGGSVDSMHNARRRVVVVHGAPDFEHQELRVTCGTYLANAPSIFRAVATSKAAQWLGHCERIAEKHYRHAVEVDAKHTTIEDAMGLDIKPDESGAFSDVPKL